MYQKQSKFKESFDFYQQASKEAKKSKDRFLMAVQYQKIGFFYRAQNKDKEAQKEYNKLLEILKKIEKPSETDNKRDRRYRHYTIIQSLVDVCQYLQTFPEQKGQAKAIAKEAVRIYDRLEYTFRNFLRDTK
jgi:tetratricopeptide (TPR) repeat protein